MDVWGGGQNQAEVHKYLYCVLSAAWLPFLGLLCGCFVLFCRRFVVDSLVVDKPVQVLLALVRRTHCLIYLMYVYAGTNQGSAFGWRCDTVRDVAAVLSV